MTIKDELKSKLKKSNEKEDDELELKATEMIEEFLIPKFREIAQKKPECDYLKITFHNNMGGWFYTSNIDDWSKRRKSPYKVSVVSKAVKIAYKFDIEARSLEENYVADDYEFVLDLR